jgi:hypothetical protein
MNGDEPADVLQYQSKYDKFPHELTANQFFNEALFESYVQLGSHVVREIVHQSSQEVRLTMDKFVQAAKDHAGLLSKSAPLLIA